MPTCHISLSENVKNLSLLEIEKIRDIVADGLNSKARYLDRHHIVVRILRTQREHMLGDVEVEIYAQFFIRRFFSRDKRSKFISQNISKILNLDCATWINLCVVGYSRVTVSGEIHYSDKASQAERPKEFKF